MRISIIGLMFSCLCLAPMCAGEPQEPPAPRVVSLDSPDKNVLQLLSGPPETVTMRSGRVILAPGKSVGKHSTGQNEEVLVILEGRGEMRIMGKDALKLDKNVVAYCPPHTEHDVLNTGTGVLRYVYIVARAH
jgi:mannose-6-phosphate isomerase-like protein (cupin superfamily)